jgi:hypothetical protein
MTPRDDIPVRQRPRFPKRLFERADLVWLASHIANVIEAGGSHRGKGRTYGRNAPYGVSKRKRALDRGVVPHMGIPNESQFPAVGIS